MEAYLRNKRLRHYETCKDCRVSGSWRILSFAWLVCAWVLGIGTDGVMNGSIRDAPNLKVALMILILRVCLLLFFRYKK